MCLPSCIGCIVVSIFCGVSPAPSTTLCFTHLLFFGHGYYCVRGCIYVVSPLALWRFDTFSECSECIEFVLFYSPWIFDFFLVFFLFLHSYFLFIILQFSVHARCQPARLSFLFFRVDCTCCWYIGVRAWVRPAFIVCFPLFLCFFLDLTQNTIFILACSWLSCHCLTVRLHAHPIAPIRLPPHLPLHNIITQYHHFCHLSTPLVHPCTHPPPFKPTFSLHM